MLMKHFGNKRTLLFGLLFEMLQLFMIGFGSTAWYDSILQVVLITNYKHVVLEVHVNV